MGFAATREPGRTDSEAWTIDAMGTRFAARRRGVGAALARHCLAAARAAGDADCYCIDVVPTAVGFWTRLGFEEAEPTAEQLVFLKRGGDRPMVLRLR